MSWLDALFPQNHEFDVYTQLQAKGLPLKLSRERSEPETKPMSLQEMEEKAVKLRRTSWQRLLEDE